MTGIGAGISALSTGASPKAIGQHTQRALRQGLRIVVLKTSNLFRELQQTLLKQTDDPDRMQVAVEKNFQIQIYASGWLASFSSHCTAMLERNWKFIAAPIAMASFFVSGGRDFIWSHA